MIFHRLWTPRTIQTQNFHIWKFVLSFSSEGRSYKQLEPADLTAANTATVEDFIFPAVKAEDGPDMFRVGIV